MPAYNASRTLEQTVRDIPAGAVDEIILCDDCSSDDTVEVDMKTMEVTDGTTFLLCSDGITRHISDNAYSNAKRAGCVKPV